jgi:Flp pilus assembly protein TadG
MRPRRSPSSPPRRGASMVEFAVVLPALVALLFGLVVLGLGVSRQQRLTLLARQAARWASVHGKQYARDTNQPAATAQDVYTTAIAPNLAGFNTSLVTYSVSWNTDNDVYHAVQDANGNLKKVSNTVTVTVSYQWVPEGLLGAMTLSGSAAQTMSY